MELNQILERLQFTIDKAKELKPEQFNYSDYIEKFDYKNHCGTVCCIVGHYPNWKICPFYYDTSFSVSVKYRGYYSLNAGLQDYHGLSSDLVNFLFYGSKINHPLFVQFHANSTKFPLSLHSVIARFEYVNELLAKDIIAPHFEIV